MKRSPRARLRAREQRPGSAQDLLRQIPSVEELLGRPRIRELSEKCGRKFVTERVREVLAAVRRKIQEGHSDDVREERLESAIRNAVETELSGSLQPVINAAGVILHTNLGRAPLAREAVEHALDVTTQYSNLEYDLASGQRGQRDVHVARELQELLGAPAAIVVNNNAAAVWLTLNTLADGGEVIVSRGELVEIGGGFRIPDIMQKSGALLREVGTTNRTVAADYEKAINENTKLLLRVHPSNFRVVGFTARPSLGELVALGAKHGVPVYEDLGSGCLVSGQGLIDEPAVADSMAAGADVVSFSGDKLLGGPQAGVIAGKKELVERIRRNPLFRALRVDKLTYAVMQWTLQAYRQDQLDRIPIWRMIRMTIEEIEQRANGIVQTCASHGCAGLLDMELVDGASVIGGGSAPGLTIPTRLIALRSANPGTSASSLEKRLLACRRPVVARTESDRVLLDLRTVLPEEDGALAQAILSLVQGAEPPRRQEPK